MSWVKEVLKALEDDGKVLGTSKIDWQVVRDNAMRYVEEKKTQHRWDGQATFDQTQVATWDLLEGVETKP